MNRGIVHFEIPAEDPQRAVDFYRGLFGWQITEVTSMPGVEYWTIETGEREPGMLSGGGLMRRQAPDQGITTYINVESVDATIARAQELGATLIVPKMPVGDFGLFAQFTDPDGNVFAVWERVRAADAQPAASAAAAG